MLKPSDSMFIRILPSPPHRLLSNLNELKDFLSYLTAQLPQSLKFSLNPDIRLQSKFLSSIDNILMQSAIHLSLYYLIMQVKVIYLIF